MSKTLLQTKLDQINLKIQQAHEEREAFLKEYYEMITQKLMLIEAHALPSDVLVGALIDAIQKYNAKDNVISKWEGMAHPFFRSKRSARPTNVTEKSSDDHKRNRSIESKSSKVEKELVHD